MEFDDTDLDLQGTARIVYDRIPEGARRRIESVCECITFAADGDSEAVFLPALREIQVFVSRIGDFSDKGRLGVLAHEFGHAFNYARGHHRPGKSAETLANMIAQSWGFLAEINAMKKDTDRLRDHQ